MNIDNPTLQNVFDRTLQWSRERDFAGYSKHDAMNSRFLAACSLGVPCLRLLITQAVMRAPFNVRPWLGVPRARNPKGAGLFAHACLDMAEACSSAAERAGYMAVAGQLLAWLAGRPSPQTPLPPELASLFAIKKEPASATAVAAGLQGLGWGYHYPWQDAGFFQPRHYPNRVVTSWIGLAFLRACEMTGEKRYLAVCGMIARFLTANPRVLHQSPEEICLSYVPLADIKVAVMDVSALVAAFLACYTKLLTAAGTDGDYAAADDIERYRKLSRRLMAFVVSRQTPYGAWYYTWPARDSHIRHDNYHTAIILDCLADYMENTQDMEWLQAYRSGLRYYRRILFTSEGAPRWMNDRTWPHDIHGAASGILAFTRAAAFDVEAQGDHIAMADRILSWTLRNLYDGRGFFMYQRSRWMTRRFCLMRWGNAWMCRALARRLVFDRRNAV